MLRIRRSLAFRSSTVRSDLVGKRFRIELNGTSVDMDNVRFFKKSSCAGDCRIELDDFVLFAEQWNP